MPALSRKKLLTGVILAFVLFFAILLLVPFIARLLQLGKEPTYWFSRFSFWAGLAVLLAYVVKVEKQPFLLWKESRQNIWFYLLSFIAIIVTIYIGSIMIAIILKVMHLSSTSKRFLQVLEIFRHDIPLMLFTCITAGATEEFVFRGYMMPRLQLLFNNPFITIGVSSFLFAILHIGYGTVNQVIGPLFIGCVFAIHYYKFRNIRVLMFCHFFWDLQAMLINLAYYKHP